MIFETAENGADQERLRRAGFWVIGSSAMGDLLKADREFSQHALLNIGM